MCHVLEIVISDIIVKKKTTGICVIAVNSSGSFNADFMVSKSFRIKWERSEAETVLKW